MFDSLARLNESRKGVRRRTFLIAAAAGAAGVWLYRWWRRQPMPVAQRPVRYITPNRDFYQVSIDPAFPPKPDLNSWRLEIAGPGGEDRLSLSDLAARQPRRIPRTFMCISNRVGGDSIGNAEWTATPLGPILEPICGTAGPDLRAVFYGMDGFYSSVPLETALDKESFLAWEMNGAPLPREHGFPLRVLLPGKYGMKQPRWLQRIEITSDSVSGYWESRAWSDQCDVKMTARIDSAKPTEGGRWKVSGVAFCGSRTVGRVEVSADRGRSWAPALLTSPTLPNAWALWVYDWIPPGPGEYVFSARVADGAGNAQIEAFSGSFPSGSTGLHQVIVKV